jgi:hypothetical protein
MFEQEKIKVVTTIALFVKKIVYHVIKGIQDP